jgi:hypothetical protein
VRPCLNGSSQGTERADRARELLIGRIVLPATVSRSKSQGGAVRPRTTQDLPGSVNLTMAPFVFVPILISPSA